jgi:hypothetical protein
MGFDDGPCFPAEPVGTRNREGSYPHLLVSPRFYFQSSSFHRNHFSFRCLNLGHIYARHFFEGMGFKLKIRTQCVYR